MDATSFLLAVDGFLLRNISGTFFCKLTCLTNVRGSIHTAALKMLLFAVGKYAGIHANGRILGGERISNMWKNSIIL